MLNKEIFHTLIEIDPLNFDASAEKVISSIGSEENAFIQAFINSLNFAIEKRPNLLKHYANLVSCVVNSLSSDGEKMLKQELKEKISSIFLGLLVNSEIIKASDILRLSQEKKELALLFCSENVKKEKESVLNEISEKYKEAIENNWSKIYDMFIDDNASYLSNIKRNKVLYPFGEAPKSIHLIEFAAYFGAKNVFVTLASGGVNLKSPSFNRIAFACVKGGSVEILKFMKKKGISIKEPSLIDCAIQSMRKPMLTFIYTQLHPEDLKKPELPSIIDSLLNSNKD